MKNKKETTKTYPIHVEAIINRPFFEEIAKNNNKNTHGITLIALVITIIILLILAGVVLNLTLGEHGILKKAEQGAEQYKISEILEKLELEKVDLVARKNGEVASLQEYIDHLINKGTITLADVTDIDDNNKNIVVEGYVFLVEKEQGGNIKITYQGKDTKEPRIAKIQVIGTTIDSISVKVIASNANGASYKYSIKNVTLGETEFTEVTTLNTNEYTFTGLTTNNEYIIQVELITSEGTDIKETGVIKTEPPKVTSITLDKTNIEIAKGRKKSIVATVLPSDAIDKTVRWESSNESVAIVDDNGMVTAIGEGVCIVKVSANSDNLISATCDVNVTLPPAEIVEGNSTHTAKQISYSWNDLSTIAKEISNSYGTEEGQINSNTAEVIVTINGNTNTLGIGDYTTVNGKQVRILGFNHDPLTNQNAYGEGETNIYAGISFEFVNAVLTKTRFHRNRSVEVWWSNCDLRNTLNNTTYNSLENKQYIKEVNKQSISKFNNAGSVKMTSDKLWLLSCSEIWNNAKISGSAYGYAIAKEGEQYEYYAVINANCKVENAKLVKDNAYWTLRSLDWDTGGDMACMSDKGDVFASYYDALGQIIPCFAI